MRVAGCDFFPGSAWPSPGASASRADRRAPWFAVSGALIAATGALMWGLLSARGLDAAVAPGAAEAA